MGLVMVAQARCWVKSALWLVVRESEGRRPPARCTL